MNKNNDLKLFFFSLVLCFLSADAQLSQCSWLPDKWGKSANLSWLAIQAEALDMRGCPAGLLETPAGRFLARVCPPRLQELSRTLPLLGFQVLTVTLREGSSSVCYPVHPHILLTDSFLSTSLGFFQPLFSEKPTTPDPHPGHP